MLTELQKEFDELERNLIDFSKIRPGDSFTIKNFTTPRGAKNVLWVFKSKPNFESMPNMIEITKSTIALVIGMHVHHVYALIDGHLAWISFMDIKEIQRY